jgi:DNA polymerase III delta prime subunit
MFLIDKYTPKNIDDIFFHKELYELLQLISTDDAIPHIIFHGSEGSGKKTLIKIFLEMLFDATVHDLDDVPYSVTGSGNKVADEMIKQSNYHIELEPNGNNFDRYLIHDVVKKYAKRTSLKVFKTNRKFKIVLINNIDNLSPSAQFSLRRTMEDNSDNCRFILWCNSISKVIKPLRSRCKCLRISAPKNIDMMDYILTISMRENINISLNKMCFILNESDGNIKKALWLLQIYKNNNIIVHHIDKKIRDLGVLLKSVFDCRCESVYKKIADTIIRANYTDKFRTKDIFTLVRTLSTDIYKPIKKLLNKYTDHRIFKNYRTFMEDYNKKIGKTIFLMNGNDKIEMPSKMDEIVDNIRNNFDAIVTSLELLDPYTHKERAIEKLIDLILEKSITNITAIRTILFNLMITNIKGTNSLIDIVDKIIKRPDISNIAKTRVVNISAEMEYNMIRGRREIIHFDNFIMQLYDII